MKKNLNKELDQKSLKLTVPSSNEADISQSIVPEASAPPTLTVAVNITATVSLSIMAGGKLDKTILLIKTPTVKRTMKYHQ